MNRFLRTASFGVLMAFASKAAADPSREAVVETYANIAEAVYSDSLAGARALQTAVAAFLDAPSDETLATARTAWLASRVSYQQSETFRFGNAIVDDWEGKVNAWPLDEGFIDYVDPGYGAATDANAYAALNIVANPSLTIAGQAIDASAITPALIAETLNEADGIETNVARGYHAIEFLLWGQDLNGTKAGAGNRPFTDYLQGEACTNGNCDRRAAYLRSAADLLVTDLEYITAAWSPTGPARAAVTTDPSSGLVAMLTGMGSLSYGELAGERMRLGVMLNDPEEEHDCFSDNTHNSHYYDALGIRNVYLGQYTRTDGTTLEGPSLSALVAATDPALDTELRTKLEATHAALTALKAAADNGTAYDTMLARGNAEGEALIMAGVNRLIEQTRSIERVVSALGLDNVAFEGSDSLDNPTAVFQ